MMLKSFLSPSSANWMSGNVAVRWSLESCPHILETVSQRRMTGRKLFFYWFFQVKGPLYSFSALLSRPSSCAKSKRHKLKLSPKIDWESMLWRSSNPCDCDSCSDPPVPSFLEKVFQDFEQFVCYEGPRMLDFSNKMDFHSESLESWSTSIQLWGVNALYSYYVSLSRESNFPLLHSPSRFIDCWSGDTLWQREAWFTDGKLGDRRVKHPRKTMLVGR